MCSRLEQSASVRALSLTASQIREQTESDRVKAALVTDGGWAAWGWGSDGMMVGADCVIQSRRWPTRRHRRGHPAQV